jgi:hypothetical protein
VTGQSSAANAAAEALLAAPVYTLSTRAPQIYGYDTSIPGWPWTSGDFSLVEPTAMAVLFLKKQGHTQTGRVRQGIELLRNRAVAAGGWNYGEPQVLQGDLYPAVAPTALALLALADEQDAATTAGLDWLLAQRGAITSLFSLGWAAIAANVFGVLDDGWRGDVLAAWQAAPADRRGPLEIALCLLGMSSAHPHPLRV